MLIRLISFSALVFFSASIWATPDFGPVDMAEFYTSLPAVNTADQLGKLIKAEKIATSTPDAQAWKIAYVSSDVSGKKR